MSDSNPPLSAPPSAFSLPAPAASEALNLGGAYLYRLFNGSGDDSAIEAPPFHSTYYHGEAVATSAAGVPPDLWAPPHAFVPESSAVAAEDIPNSAYPPTPVSYKMQLSDLVALTKRIRGAKDAQDAGRASSSFVKYEDATETGDGLAQTHASPQSLGELYDTMLYTLFSYVILSIQASAVLSLESRQATAAMHLSQTTALLPEWWLMGRRLVRMKTRPSRLAERWRCSSGIDGPSVNQLASV